MKNAPLALSTALLAVVLDPSSVSAQAPSRVVDLELVGDVAYLTDTTNHGVALDAGLRLGLGRYFAVALEVGYGMMGAAHVQDRWWVMPSIALVLPVAPLRIDLGAGLGLGTASGYADLDVFERAPFEPGWAFQLAPAIAGHATVAVPLSPTTSAFARLDVGALLVDGNAFGYRQRTQHLGSADTLWIALALGFAFDL
jgi:hypothetical protein